MPGRLAFPLDASPNPLSDLPPMLVTYNRVIHSLNSRLYRRVLKKCVSEFTVVGFAPQAFLGIAMSNHVLHQLSCCYLE